MKLLLKYTVFLSLSLSTYLFSQDDTTEEIVVISSKYPVALSEVIGSVNVVNFEDIEKFFRYFQIKRKNKIMITLVMLHLKMVVEDQVEVLVVLVEQTFQIFLRISLEILVVGEDQETEGQIIEVRT